MGGFLSGGSKRTNKSQLPPSIDLKGTKEEVKVLSKPKKVTSSAISSSSSSSEEDSQEEEEQEQPATRFDNLVNEVCDDEDEDEDDEDL